MLISFKAFHLTFVKKNRQNRQHRKRSGYRKKTSSDWQEKDQQESVICVQPLHCTRILFVAEGEVRSFDKGDCRSHSSLSLTSELWLRPWVR